MISYQLLLETLADGVFVAQDHRFVFCNRALPTMLGYKHEAFVGLHFNQVVAPDYLELWTTRYDQRIGSGKEPEKYYEIQFICSDGKLIWVELRASRTSFRKRPAVLGTIRDITERKYAEEKLKLWGDSFEKVEFGLAMADATTNTFISVNPAFAKQRGYSREELIGKSITSVFPATVTDQVKNMISALDAESHIVYESIHQCKDGRQFPVLLDITTIKSANGAPLRRIAYAMDISERKIAEQKLQESEERFRILMQCAPEAIVVFDVSQNRIIDANPKAEALFECELAELVKHSPLDFLQQTEADAAPIAQSFKEHNERSLDGEQLVSERKLIGAKGRESICEVRLTSQPSNGKPLVRASIVDITTRKQSEEKLKLSARVFDEAYEGIIITDAAGTIIDVNPTFCEITGYSREDAIGQNPRFLSSGRHSPAFYKEMWSALANEGYWTGEVWNRKKHGELYVEMLTISAMRDHQGTITHYVGLFSDITQAKHQQQALEQMAHYDLLTQLPNRALFSDRFQQAIAHTKREASILAVCYLDLDGFKQVNDLFGHEVGDRLLIEVAERIKNCLREEDTVSRLGGDEFAILMSNLRSLDECEQALKRVHHTLAQDFVIESHAIHITASSGVALYPQDNADPDTLLRHADQAMYQAKSTGRNRFHLFDAVHDHEIQSRRELQRSIEEAFSRQEFCLYYQPKVNMPTGQVLGVEALIRWNHPERGLVPPIEFLPLIENTEFEIVLGNWVVDQALLQASTWNQLGLSLQVSVNISPHHLQWPEFVAQLETTLSRYPRIPSHQLQLEVLESSMVSDLGSMSKVLSICRDELGVSIALDDFGTGYSSLTYLRHLPTNTIKIDQSFVRDMLDDPSDFAIVDGVVGLAEAFRREVIAEGVESREHGLVLLTIGCQMPKAMGSHDPCLQMQFWNGSGITFQMKHGKTTGETHSQKEKPRFCNYPLRGGIGCIAWKPVSNLPLKRTLRGRSWIFPYANAAAGCIKHEKISSLIKPH